jgi:hypothetical protein
MVSYIEVTDLSNLKDQAIGTRPHLEGTFPEVSSPKIISLNVAELSGY